MTEIPERLGAIDWSPLARQLHGTLVRPDDERMVLAGKHFAAGKALVIPQALIRCQGLDDVRRSLEFLRLQQVPFSVRSGGHCFGDLSSNTGAIIDLGEMNQIEMHEDEAGGASVRVGPGTVAADISRALASRGRVIPTGGCPWVGLGGLSLAGGFGFLGRRHGLTTDQVERLQVVTADGRVLEAAADSDPDLFWALRGAGTAGFGIITDMTLRTHALSALTVCHGAWPLEQAVGLIDRWQHWAPEAHEDTNLELGLIGPDDPEDACYIELFGIVLGNPAESTPHLKAVSDFLGPLARKLRAWSLPGPAASEYLVGLLNHQTAPAWQPSRPYRETGFQFTRSDFFEGHLDLDAIRDCVAQFQADRRYAQARELEIIPWGGAYARTNPDACFLHRAPRMLIRHTTMTGTRSTQDLRDHARQWVDASQATISRHANGHVYQGYADLRLQHWSQAYYGDTWPRLQRIKRQCDPDQVFRHVQSIVPA